MKPSPGRAAPTDPDAPAPPGGWPSLGEVREAARNGDGSGVRVAVIDSGLETTHPRLASLKVVEALAFLEKAAGIEVLEDAPGDPYGHGTAVADIVHRLAPGAEIGSFRVIDGRSLSRTHLICAGVREAIARGYHVINCSFGCRGLAKFILPHKEWADEAWLRGVHVVAACSNLDSSEAEWPSHFASVVGVDLADCRGEKLYYRPDHMVSFSARGENVEVAWSGGGVQVQTGTSYAAPRVAALIARILSRHPGLPPSFMHAALASVAEPWRPELSADW